MTVFALVLVLAAATFHATWNLLAKRVGDGGAVFVWLFGFLAMLIYAPLAEGDARRRLAAASVMVLGILALALG